MKRLWPVLLIVSISISVLYGQTQPVVRLPPLTPLLSAVSATSTQTGTAVRIATLSAYGTLAVTSVGITGSPSGCQIVLNVQQSTGTIASSATATQAITLDNTYHAYAITPSQGVAADALIAVYSCGVYPSAGTITVTFAPIDVVQVQGTVPISGTFWQTTQPVSIATMPTTPVTGTFFQATQPVSGTVTANAGSGTFNVSAAQSGTWTMQPGNTANTTAWLVTGTGGTFPVTGTFFQATQPVSAVSLPLPSGAATSAKQPALGTAGTAASDVITIQGIASMTAVKTDSSATTQPVSGTVTANAGSGTFNVSAAQSGTWTIQPGNTANTTAWLVTGAGGTFPVTGTVTTTPPANASTNLTQISGTTLTIGQQTAANSIPVILPSATITTLTPPAAITGFALEAGHLATIDSHIPALGQALAAASIPVILPAATVTTLTPPAAITGFALEAGHLATIDTKTPSLGQALAAASVPVILPSATITTLTPPAAITNFANETGGNLATIAGAVTSTRVQTNTSQINGVTPLMGNGVTGTGSQRVTIASDNTAFNVTAASTLAAETTKVIGTVRHVGNVGGVMDAVTGAAVPANAMQIGGTDGTNLIVPFIDPCQRGAKSYFVISLTTNTQLITGTASKKTYICAINLVAGAATNVALVEGTGTVCATSIAGMAGGSTAATGWNFGANGGLTLGSGASAVIATATNANNVCMLVSAANQISGTIAYVQY